MNAIDTNVLVYYIDEASPEKRRVAQALLRDLENGVLLWQVACEFHSAARRVLKPDNSPERIWKRFDEVRGILPLIAPRPATLPRAKTIQLTFQAQFWDALIYAACLDAGVTTLYSEDVPAQPIPGLTIINPFAHLASA